MVTRDQIEALAQRIAEEFRPERIILFGSHARGVPSEESDVDLLVIMPFEGDSIHQAVAMRRTTRPKFPVDFVVRTSESVRERVALNDWFLREALEQGQVLYETADV